MKHILKFFTLLFIATLISCGNANNNVGYNSYSSDEMFLSEDDYTNTSDNDFNKESERKIIKEGSIKFTTSDVIKTKKFISNSLTEFKGYYSYDNVYDYNDKIEYSISVKVPAENFDSLISRITMNAGTLEHKEISTLDVTEEFIDIEARLSNKKELENRYNELLKQAKSVDEILSIEKESNSLRSDIESIEGRLKYLKDKVAYSTLNITFYQKKNVDFGFGSKVFKAIENGWSNMLLFCIGLINLWPFIIIAIVLAVFYRKYRKRAK